MSGGGALNLSLLSRGVGEVQKNGHEKVEVFLEPSDYFNFAADRPYYLPPIQTGYHFTESSPRISTRSARDGSEIPLPKTFTTRKGALLLFSEDMALKANDQEHHHKKSRRHHPMHSSFPSHSSLGEDETAIVLKTVDDLAKSILQYGSSRHSFHDDRGKMYLKFIHRRHEQWERQIRPGYSAKRYLSTWTRNWDDQVFETVVSKGYLTERSLFHYNLFLPNLRRQLFHEDLSIMPQPYRLMKNMLLTPGSLSGYSFYRVPQTAEFGTVMEEDEDDADGIRVQRPDTKRSIRVIRTTRDGVQKEVSYSALDKDTQREVITDLLVKSAVHYALSKQEEILEESLAQAMQSEHDGVATSYPELSETRRTPAMQQTVTSFDMRNAVDSLLDTNRGGPYVLGGDLPDNDARSHSSEHTGSFKGGAVPLHAARSMGARHTPRGSWPVTVEDTDKEFMGDLPVAAMRDMSTASSSMSSIPQLPPIGKVPLSPIKDVSRETSQLVMLPRIHHDDHDHAGSMPTVQVMPPTPQQSTLTGALATPRSDGQRLQRVTEGDPTLAEVSGYNLSRESTPRDPAAPAPTVRTGRKSKIKGPKVTHGPGGTGILFQPPDRASSIPPHNAFTATPSHAGAVWEHGRMVEGRGHKKVRSLAAGSLESKSVKGSMIMAPDGEIISVGGSVVPSRPHDVGVIGDVTQPHRHYDANMTDESGMSDDEPDEWRTTGRVKKPRSLSSKLSDSVKRTVKRDSETSRASGAKSAVSSEKGGKESGSGGSIIIKRYSVTSKEIDYTSGDIDATMSIHSWSYAPKGEEGEFGLVKAGSVRSLPGLSYDGGLKESLNSTAEQTYEDDNSEEDDERWARITERPEEEEVTNMLESREPTMDVIPQTDNLSPDKQPSPGDQTSSGQSSSKEHQHVTTDNLSVTPRDALPASHDEHHSPREKGTKSSSKHTTPGPASKHTTPGVASKHTTPGPASKHVSPGDTMLSPGVLQTPGSRRDSEPVPTANGPRPTPASVSLPPSEGDFDDDNRDTGTSRSKSVALQTESATPEHPTPRGFPTGTPRRDSGRDSGGEEEEVAGVDQWLPDGTKETLDVVPEESQKSSAAPSRIPSSAVDKRATPAPSRSQTADESGKAGSKAESRKGESRQGSSRTAKSREPSSRRAVSRTGSGQGDGTASRAEQQQQQFQQHGEASVIREETSVTEASRAKSSAQDGPQETKPSPAGQTSVEDEREQAVTSAAQVEQTGRASKEKGPSRSDKSSSKTGPSPQTESKASRAPSKVGSRGPSQLGRSSKEPGARSPAAPSARSDARSSGKASTQLKAKGSVSDDKSRGTSSKLSQRSQMTKSRAKDGSRSVSTRLSAARMTTPPPGEESAEHQWDDVNDGFEPSDHGSELGYDDNRPPSTPSSATEDDARVSGEEPPNQGMALSVEGTQMLTPPETPAQGHRTRMTVQESVTEEPEAETATLASQTARSSVTEQDILDTLTEHAKRIADSVLSNTEAGQDLEKDVREAADMWMDTHSTHNISRSHSVHDVLRSGAIQEIMDAQRSSSAGPTTSEYKDLIRQSLTTAVAKAAGLDPEQFPEDAEISPDLLEALASQKLTPDDIAIYHDEETGRPVIKSRQEIAQALGGVSEGHIYMVPNGKGGSYVGSDAGIKRQMSIPADRASLVDNMEYDVISYGGTEVMSERGRPAGKSKAGSKPGSIAGGTIADLKDHPFESVKGSVDVSPEAEQDAFEQRLQQMEKDVAGADKKSPSQRRASKGEDQTPALPGDGSPKLTLDLDGQSVKSGKTGVSQKTEKSEESKKKKAKTPDEPFVVGQSGQKGELEKLYGPADSPTKKKDKGKADDKASDKSPHLSDKSPRQLDKSPRLSDNSPRKSDKSPRVSDKSPRVKDKSPQSQLKSPRKSGKTPRPEPTGADAPDMASKTKQTASKQRLPRAKKEKAANPRRGSRALEAREEIEKDEDVKNTQLEITEKETEQRQAERQTKEESEPKVPEARTVSPKAAEQPSAMASVEQTTPRVADGMPKQKADLSELFGAQGPGSLPQGPGAGKSESKSPVKGRKPKKDDKKEKGKKKGKKKKDKKEEEAAPEPEPTPAAEAPPSAPIPETKEPTPVPPSSREPPVSKPMTASSSERPLQSSPELKTDDEMEFTIVREESSPEPEPPQRTSLPPTYPVEEEEEEEEEDIGDNGEEDNLKAISNREARAAKRAAAAAKRKEEVERRRKEREEQVKREKEELERQEQLKREMEMERKRREEERRLRKQKEAEEADRELREMEEQERRKKLAEERERKAKEEYQRKLEEMRRKQLEEEAKRMELQLQKQKEEEERRAQEELMLSQMAEQERLEYEKKKKEEEEERKRKEEAERLKREEEARQAMEEARRLAEEMARKQAELEARLKFNRALQMEAGGLDHSHDINRAFVFSYFELLQWLGLDIPEFELAKMSQL